MVGIICPLVSIAVVGWHYIYYWVTFTMSPPDTDNYAIMNMTTLSRVNMTEGICSDSPYERQLVSDYKYDEVCYMSNGNSQSDYVLLTCWGLYIFGACGQCWLYVREGVKVILIEPKRGDAVGAVLSPSPSFISGPQLPVCHLGGGQRQTISYGEIEPFCLDKPVVRPVSSKTFKFFGHCKLTKSSAMMPEHALKCQLPMEILLPILTLSAMRDVGGAHGIRLPQRTSVKGWREKLSEHVCLGMPCIDVVSVLQPTEITVSDFPPVPMTEQLERTIIEQFCQRMSPSAFEETGCMVCGELKNTKSLRPAMECEFDHGLLVEPTATVRERLRSDDIVQHMEGPVLARGCNHVCHQCLTFLEKGKRPPLSLANGLWLGEVPPVLQDLSFAEKLMIAKIRHNKCVVRVASGRGRLTANAVMFSNPTLKIYNKLPPSKDELSEVLAFVFIGSALPSEETFERTPMLVRRNKVSDALNWLKLNHEGYRELEISEENLNSYDLKGVPVTVEWKQTGEHDPVQEALATSVHEAHNAEGTEKGPCTFRVHGLTGEAYDSMSIQALKTRALTHMNRGHASLGIGHDDKPQSMYENPLAYPCMFPWLFPYGKGGLGNEFIMSRLGELAHKRHLLLYHDKRFQFDLYFPLVAFNHDQIKSGTTGSFLMARRSKFDEIVNRLEALDVTVLASLAEKMGDGNQVRIETDAERNCFAAIEDLDLVGGHVKGSITNKKYMRNEIWSLISHLGTPSWFITLSPADSKHPLCLYYADTGIDFSPDLRTSDERNLLISQNPVAAARFFDFAVRLFVEIVLGVGATHTGAYGDTSAYYGTVEQQGRLTLHLHTLVWVKDALSPQQIRDRLKSPRATDFQQRLIAYLDGSHMGQFLTGDMEEVRGRMPPAPNPRRRGFHDLLDEADEVPVPNNPRATDPTQVLPESPPMVCTGGTCSENVRCDAHMNWRHQFERTVDELIFRTNVHSCIKSSQSNDKSRTGRPSNRPPAPSGCLNSEGVCTARFPRPIVKETTVDMTDGSIILKKLEAMINTFTPLLTYLLRCNTDVTSLLSGTAIKAIVAYVTDYLTKSKLKTHHIFSTMIDVIERNVTVMLGSDGQARRENARRLILQIVNALTSQLEIGSPMASMYLLGNPDHYCSHTFKVFWWRNYVLKVQQCWDNEKPSVGIDEEVERVVLAREGGKWTGSSSVDDYVYRPAIYNNVNLIDWIRMYTKKRLPKSCRENGTTPKDWYRLGVEHPNMETHIVQCDSALLDSIVPNFVGGALPRRDVGDREFYCCTMLTLFVPWRTGRDLKNDEDSWEDVCNRYPFSDEHRRKMANFNLRYECNDARDDYYLTIKKRTAEAKRSREGWSKESMLGDENEFLNESATVNYGDDDLFNDDMYSMGDRTLRRLNSMREAEKIMRRTGWLDPRLHQMRLNTTVFCPEFRMSSAEWRSVVASQRALELEVKLNKIPPKSKGHLMMIRKEDVNRVEEMDGHVMLNVRSEKEAAVNKLIVETICEKYRLNQEQRRAYVLVTRHALGNTEVPMKMFLTGMAGTGKSQVIKALIEFFEARDEAYRFVILAPTGSAAALLGGSTYHSFLGISGKQSDGPRSTAMRQVQAKLRGVDYVFLDEVSMLSCRELYQISAKLAKALNVPDKAFGGMSMIFAGDFAQLGPVNGRPLFSGYDTVRPVINARMSVAAQEESIGKAIWNQVIEVVVLRQNMRQTSMGKGDNELRKALENMRYGACTEADLEFLRTRTVGHNCDGPKLTDLRFRDVPIITAWNAQKDKINELGCERFANDTAQTLTSFFSIDSIAPITGVARKRYSKPVNIKGQVTALTPAMKKALWDAPPCSSDHFAGELKLCVGMPVMIRNNDATELCITKGQEATVFGWDAMQGPDGRVVLETLFLKLTNPPKCVRIGNLPENIVPMPRTSDVVECCLPNDYRVKIKRQQVQVLPCFALTDYASQGKTRPLNVVDLGHCRSHFSYYTCLSRSASADGTVIIQGFNERKITSGISGHLRQEFRELALLDEISKLRFDGVLDPVVCGDYRNALVRNYQVYKGTLYDPEGLHHTLTTHPENRPRLPNEEENGEWMIVGRTVEHNDVGSAVSLKASCVPMLEQSLVVAATRKEIEGEVHHERPAKRRKLRKMTVLPGFAWDSSNYSCVYDSVFTICLNLWLENCEQWSNLLIADNVMISGLLAGFEGAMVGSNTLEQARDHMRHLLHDVDPSRFPYGKVWSYLDCIPYHLMGKCSILDVLICDECQFEDRDRTCHSSVPAPLYVNGGQTAGTSCLSDWLRGNTERPSNRFCPNCKGNMIRRRVFQQIPALLCLSVSDNQVTFERELTIPVEGGRSHTARLAGVVYSGNFHFTSRFIDREGEVWYHDGITTSKAAVIDNDHGDLRKCDRDGGTAALLFYARADI